MLTRLLSVALFAVPLVARAQNILVVREGNADQVVRAVNYNQPMVEVDGKFRQASGTQFALRKAAAYRRGFVKVPDFLVRITHTDSLGSDFGYGIDILGHVQSDTALKRCFIVLEITSGKDRGLIYNELPDLPADETREVRVVAHLQEPLDPGRYTIHVFSDGLELLNSKMPQGYIMQQTKKTDELMLMKAPDRNVTLSREKAAIDPVYPAALASQGLVGSAKVKCRISAQGDVMSAEVVEASHPLFGEAAVAAVRQWKFAPAIIDHHYVEATVIVPVDFPAPAGSTAAKQAGKP